MFIILSDRYTVYVQFDYYKLQKKKSIWFCVIEDGQFLWMCMCSGHMTERSNERKGFKYLSVYSKQAQAAAIKNINAKKHVFSSDDLKQ